MLGGKVAIIAGASSGIGDTIAKKISIKGSVLSNLMRWLMVILSKNLRTLNVIFNLRKIQVSGRDCIESIFLKAPVAILGVWDLWGGEGFRIS